MPRQAPIARVTRIFRNRELRLELHLLFFQFALLLKLWMSSCCARSRSCSRRAASSRVLTSSCWMQRDVVDSQQQGDQHDAEYTEDRYESGSFDTDLAGIHAGCR